MASLRGLLEDYSAAEECTTIVHFPSTDDTSILSLPRLVPPVPYAAATALDLYTQDQLPRNYPLARMLETLSGALPISRFAPGWGPNGQLSMTHLDLCVVDVEAMYYPTHALFAFSPNDTTQMTLYLVHCVVLWVFCPAFYDKLPYSPIQEDIFSPTIIPRCITVPVHPFCIAYPEALGIFLPYFYLRDTRTLVCQCLPLLDWISRNDDNIIATLQDKSVGESLGYALAQEVPFQTLVEFTVKTYSLSLSAWDMTIQDPQLWTILSCCYEILLNALAYTTAGCTLTSLMDEEED
ncbi:hypothetical protein EV360DRAFT_87227 [Lentinula raphanica]|nr:hypothetical protein EV360DRAFT_87227 [Lentinula raphanica]